MFVSQPRSVLVSTDENSASIACSSSDHPPQIVLDMKEEPTISQCQIMEVYNDRHGF